MKSKLSTTKPDTDLAAWCAALLPANVDKIPAGWLTCAELADKLGKTKDTVSGQLSVAVRAGRAEMQKYRVMTNRGVYPIPHYRLK
jgi:hypothetical protein